MAAIMLAGTTAYATSQTITDTTSDKNSAERIIKSYSRYSAGYDNFHVSAAGSDGTGYDGFYVEWVIQGTPLSKTSPLFLEWGLRFNGEYYSDSAEKSKQSTNVYTVGIPLNITYHFSLGDTGAKLAPYAGVNFKVHVSGESKYTYKTLLTTTVGEGTRFETTSTKEIDKTDTLNLFSKDDMGEGAWKRFQMGWQIGVNLEIKRFVIGLGYGTDFVKLAKRTNTSNFTVGIGINF